MKNQTFEVEYFFLKTSIQNFRKDLQNFRNLMKSIPEDKLFELIAEIIGIKELIEEGIEKDFMHYSQI
jgi:hypothetical protein